jgi:hypothetical protein
MNVEQFQQWRHDPLTVLFHKYLTDYRQSLMERWAAGKLQEPESTMAMGQCQMLLELTSLDDDTIGNFYRQQPKEGSDDAPGNQEAG